MENKYNKLKELIEKYNYHYYEKNESLVSDKEYDELLEALIKLEEENPSLKDLSSPTKKVGGFVNEKFSKVKHSKPMLSLANTYSISDVFEFDKRINNIINKHLPYVLELKLDGISIDLKYKKGRLDLALTRGDGEFGEDVTENVYEIKNIPKKLKKDVDIEVRGEIVLPISEFNRLNEERMENGEDVFSNPRNAAAGTIRQLDKEIVAERNLKCFVYYVVNTGDFNLKTHLDSIKLLEELGFETTKIFELHDNLETLENSINMWNDKRKKLDYETDGLVFKVNDLSYYEALGYTSKSPRWAIAYKFKPDQIETKIESIDLQVGRTGVITPVANFKAVNLSGSIVKRASIHNFDEIKRKDIRLYDYVIIEKAAEIIPQIVKVLTDKRNGSEEIITIPKNCPSCNQKTYTFDNIVAVKCLNKYCPAQIIRSVEYFVSRDAMNIKGLGSKITKKLIDLGFITNILDLYNLKNFKDKLITLDKMGEKNIQNLLDNIEKSKEVSFDRLLFSLGIPYIGKNTSKLICKHLKDIDSLINADLETLKNIKGLGEKGATSIINFFEDKHNILLIKSFKELGFNLEMKEALEKHHPFITNKSFLATGTLTSYKRDEIKDLILSYGGIYLSAVSKNLDYLIVGEKAGSKLKKAQELGITILTENDFKNNLNIEGK